MTEEEWFACEYPAVLACYFKGRFSDRKVRLCCCACWRQADSEYYPEAARRLTALELLEGYADRRVNRKEALAAVRAAVAANALDVHFPHLFWSNRCDHGANMVLTSVQWSGEEYAHRAGRTSGDSVRRERRDQSNLVRDILGNPFRPVSVNATSVPPRVTSLAQAAYDARALPVGTLDSVRLAVLADALEEAGCANPDLLGHLRGPGPHVRGCWALDLLLGKE